VAYDLAEEEIIKRALKGTAKIQVYNFLSPPFNKDFYSRKIKKICKEMC